jgi:hypothetical protein
LLKLESSSWNINPDIRNQFRTLYVLCRSFLISVGKNVSPDWVAF